MKFSIVIPTHQRRGVLARTLDTVFAQDFDARQYEVIVVVDGSTDGTAEFLRNLSRPRCTFKFIEQPNMGSAAARNAGLRTACGEVVLFLDDDLLCDAGLIRAHCEAHQRSPNSVISGTILPMPQLRSLAADLDAKTLLHLSSLVKTGGSARWPQVACGANDSVSRGTLLQAGGYDERFACMREDVDLGIRLWKMGVLTHYASDAVVYHMYEKSSDDLVAKESVRFARNELLLCRAHPEYRPFSPFRQPFIGPWRRRLKMQVLGHLPLSFERLMRPACVLAENMRRLPIARRIGVRLLSGRMLIVEFRTAVAITGSWRALREEFSR